MSVKPASKNFDSLSNDIGLKSHLRYNLLRKKNLLYQLKMILFFYQIKYNKILNFGPYRCIEPCLARYVLRCTDGTPGCVDITPKKS